VPSKVEEELGQHAKRGVFVTESVVQRIKTRLVVEEDEVDRPVSMRRGGGGRGGGLAHGAWAGGRLHRGDVKGGKDGLVKSRVKVEVPLSNFCEDVAVGVALVVVTEKLAGPVWENTHGHEGSGGGESRSYRRTDRLAQVLRLVLGVELKNTRPGAGVRIERSTKEAVAGKRARVSLCARMDIQRRSETFSSNAENGVKLGHDE
jgi:hypothetical protein